MITAKENTRCLALEPKQRQAGRTTSLGGIKTVDRTFLPTVDSQNGCIQIEDRCSSEVRAAKQFLSPRIVKPNRLVSPRDSKTLQKATQRCRCWIPRKSCQVLKDSIAAQGLGRFDSSQAKDVRIQQSLDHFADGVLVLALSKTNPSLQ